MPAAPQCLLGDLQNEKVFSIVAALGVALVAQASFGDLLFDRGLPPDTASLSQPAQPLGTGVWGSTISITDLDPKDADYQTHPSYLPITTPGSQFVMPAAASGYYVTNVRLWITDLYHPESYSGEITNDVPAFESLYNSIGLRLGQGTTVTNLPTVPTITQVQFPGGQDFSTPNGAYYAPLIQLDYPVDMTLAGGTQYSFLILPDAKAKPTYPAEYQYYFAFMLSTEEGYSSGSPNDDATGNMSEFDYTTGVLDYQWTLSQAYGGVPNGDYNVQVFGVVPEPSTILLCVFGTLGLLGYRVWRKLERLTTKRDYGGAGIPVCRDRCLPTGRHKCLSCRKSSTSRRFSNRRLVLLAVLPTRWIFGRNTRFLYNGRLTTSSRQSRNLSRTVPRDKL